MLGDAKGEVEGEVEDLRRTHLRIHRRYTVAIDASRSGSRLEAGE